MPIRPEFRQFYKGKAYRAQRERIRQRAGDRCERCKCSNGAIIARFPSRPGMWSDIDTLDTYSEDGILLGRAKADELPDYEFALVQCGMAHLDHDPQHTDDSNVAWLCRRCHLIHDQAHHRQTRSTRKDKARPLLRELA